MSHTKLFFQQFKDDFFHMGAILPSSPALGRAGSLYLADKRGPVRVLEVGAGTGAFTQEIMPHLRSGDTLDAVEINPELITHLEKRLAQDPKFQTAEDVTINLINDDIRNLDPSLTYDYIIFSLPLTNFPPAMVQEILERMIDHLKPNGIFSYVKYIFIGRIKFWFSGSHTRDELRDYQRIIDSFTDQYQFERRAVLWNVPPTWVYYWQKSE
ncbi:MAG: methyltransferase domain-containing protein [Anaerolineae bacterium]|nr:methyltransferase domain-containing protein [Anaerolineae bacterium]